MGEVLLYIVIGILVVIVWALWFLPKKEDRWP
jgi:hypothetical protein